MSLRAHGNGALSAPGCGAVNFAESAAPGRGSRELPAALTGRASPVGRAARWRFRFADPASPDLDRQRLGDWLAARGQDERTRRRLWDLFIISALNIWQATEADGIGLAATVIKTALLGANDAADIGMAAVPLGRLHAEATADLLELGSARRCGSAPGPRVSSAADGPGGFRIRLSTR